MSRFRMSLLLVVGTLAAMLLGWLALSRRTQPVNQSAVSIPAAPTPFAVPVERRSVWWVTLLVIPGLLLLALVVHQSFELAWYGRTHQQFVMLIAGITLTAFGLAGERPHLPSLRREIVPPLLAITLLALVLRIWSLDGALRFFVDETLFSNAIVELLRDGYTQPILGRFDEVAAFTRLILC